MNPFKFLTQTRETEQRDRDQQVRLNQAFDRFHNAASEHKIVCEAIQIKSKRQGTATQIACKLISHLA